MYYLRILFSLVFPFFVAKAGLKKKSLSFSGALLGYAIGALLAYANACYVAALLAFFASGSYVTRLGAHRKVRLEADFEQGAQRNWIQVLCNGLAAALCAVAYLAFASPPRPELPIDLARYPSPSYVSLALLAALAACCGDTWASEVGAAFAWGQPRLIIGLRRVPPGTNGGVSLVGTAASCAGGGIVGLAYWLAVCAAVPADDLIAAPPQLPLLLAAGAAAGFIGSLVDSLLGATLQYSAFLRSMAGKSTVNHLLGCLSQTNSNCENDGSTLLTEFQAKVTASASAPSPGPQGDGLISADSTEEAQDLPAGTVGWIIPNKAMERSFTTTDKELFVLKDVSKRLQEKFFPIVLANIQTHSSDHGERCAKAMAKLFARLRLHHWCNSQRTLAQQRKRGRFDIDTGLVTEHPGPRIRHISGCRVLNNHLVNLLSSVITCLLLPRLALAATPWLL
uniref:Transmembrane protein 19 n=1 Tax=Macrostomum lignano TaxID=282301 RepID=A0A1I8I9Q1_9PLAT